MNKEKNENLEESEIKYDSFKIAEEHWKKLEEEEKSEKTLEKIEKNKEKYKEIKKEGQLLAKKEKEKERRQKSKENLDLLKQQIREKSNLFEEKFKDIVKKFDKKNEKNSSNSSNNSNFLVNENEKKNLINKTEQKQPEKLSKNKRKKLKKKANQSSKILDYEQSYEEIYKEINSLIQKEGIGSLCERFESEDKRALLLLGAIYKELGHHKDSFNFISLSADLKEPFAVLLKANCLYTGTEHCKQNLKEALKLFSWLIDNDYNYDVAISHLGRIYFMDYVPGENNHRKAFELYSKLENYEKTDAFVLNDLGSFYADGIYVKKDIKKGIELFNKSYEKGNDLGMKLLGMNILKNCKDEKEKEKGLDLLLDLADSNKDLTDGSLYQTIAEEFERKNEFDLAKFYYKKTIIEYEKKSSEHAVDYYEDKLSLISLYIHSSLVHSIYGEKKCFQRVIVLSKKIKEDCKDCYKAFASEADMFLKFAKETLSMLNS